jgi:hypothetical protein
MAGTRITTWFFHRHAVLSVSNFEFSIHKVKQGSCPESIVLSGHASGTHQYIAMNISEWSCLASSKLDCIDTV